MDVQNEADALHSSEELAANDGETVLKNLPFNFTLNAGHVQGGPDARLPFGFENLNIGDSSNRGKLGFPTVFAFRDRKLITGNRALSYHVNKTPEACLNGLHCGPCSSRI